MPSTTSEARSTTVLLRRFSILTFPPAFILLLAHGIASRDAFPALGLAPLGASTLLGALLLYRDQVAAIGSPVQALSTTNVFFADVLLAAALLAMLIPSWIFLTRFWTYNNNSLVMLGTYGTVFMMTNLYVSETFKFCVRLMELS